MPEDSLSAIAPNSKTWKIDSNNLSTFLSNRDTGIAPLMNVIDNIFPDGSWRIIVDVTDGNLEVSLEVALKKQYNETDKFWYPVSEATTSEHDTIDDALKWAIENLVSIAIRDCVDVSEHIELNLSVGPTSLVEEAE